MLLNIDPTRFPLPDGSEINLSEQKAFIYWGGKFYLVPRGTISIKPYEYQEGVSIEFGEDTNGI
ncbi:hypothetical protein NC981_21615 [Leptolyngbya sp. DQ-M1]|uniref:hypothetical protein n=1 Tax=Leptolyngbya sp. DQ-M1 TaxID=2933920 RepID=UPI00329A50ED